MREPRLAGVLATTRVLVIVRVDRLVGLVVTADLDELGRSFDSGQLRLAPTQVFALSEFCRAFEVAEGGVVGKVVIRLR